MQKAIKERERLVRSLSRRVKKVIFDTLAEVKEAPKTSNSHASAYMDTVAGELRSKAKPLRSQGGRLVTLNKKEKPPNQGSS